jgi:tetratricopeptide (TPR) repeat protein
MKKALICLIAVFSIALVNGAENAFIVKKDKHVITASWIKSSSSGELTYKSGKFQSKIKKKDYLYAWIPKPDEIKEADKLYKDKKYQDALKAYQENEKAYKFLGWIPYCVYMQGRSLSMLDKKPEAIAKLNELKDYKLENKLKNDVYLMHAYRLLAELYTEKAEYSKAEEALAKITQSSNEDMAAVALNMRGDIFNRQGKKKDAILMYLQTVLLFPVANKERPKALVMAANLLKETGDTQRSTLFADMLKKEYKGSQYIKELK